MGGDDLNFIGALKESLNGQKLLSCTGFVYKPNKLNVKKLSETAFVCDSVTSEKERKGNWELSDEN